MLSPMDSIPVAAIHDDGGVDADALLASFVSAQQCAGRRVGGLVMRYRGARDDCACDMVLVDVSTGDEYLASQSLGSGSTSCRVDPQAFAHASRVLRSIGEPAPDLVVCNRFGNLERQRQGFASEMLALMARGVPLLTVVSTRHLEAWAEFTGGATVLRADVAAVAAWFDGVMTADASVAR